VHTLYRPFLRLILRGARSVVNISPSSKYHLLMQAHDDKENKLVSPPEFGGSSLLFSENLPSVSNYYSACQTISKTVTPTNKMCPLDQKKQPWKEWLAAEMAGKEKPWQTFRPNTTDPSERLWYEWLDSSRHQMNEFDSISGVSPFSESI
jgi:hypothetical protein